MFKVQGINGSQSGKAHFHQVTFSQVCVISYKSLDLVFWVCFFLSALNFQSSYLLCSEGFVCAVFIPCTHWDVVREEWGFSDIKYAVKGLHWLELKWNVHIRGQHLKYSSNDLQTKNCFITCHFCYLNIQYLLHILGKYTLFDFYPRKATGSLKKECRTLLIQFNSIIATAKNQRPVTIFSFQLISTQHICQTVMKLIL